MFNFAWAFSRDPFFPLRELCKNLVQVRCHLLKTTGEEFCHLFHGKDSPNSRSSNSWRRVCVLQTDMKNKLLLLQSMICVSRFWIAGKISQQVFSPLSDSPLAGGAPSRAHLCSSSVGETTVEPQSVCPRWWEHSASRYTLLLFSCIFSLVIGRIPHSLSCQDHLRKHILLKTKSKQHSCVWS